MKFDDPRLAQHRATKPGSKFRCRLTPPRKYRRHLCRLFSALSPLPGSSHDSGRTRSPRPGLTLNVGFTFPCTSLTPKWVNLVVRLTTTIFVTRARGRHPSPC